MCVYLLTKFQVSSVILASLNSILTANDITFNGPVSLWNALQEKAAVFSDEQAVIADLK